VEVLDTGARGGGGMAGNGAWQQDSARPGRESTVAEGPPKSHSSCVVANNFKV
jgi:hypothetical protein